HLTMSGELRLAIERDELKLAFQPQIDLATRRVTGLEALMRWTHADMGPIPPDEFVTQAERTGLIQGLTFWSIEAGLSQLARIREADPSLDVAINLSARMLHDQTLFNYIEYQLKRFSLPASSVTLEITESALMANPDVAMSLLEQMSSIGLQFSIDDFGTGYSSLAYLKRLSVHELKIDKSFVLNMIEDTADAAIVRSTVDLAHHLGLRVVAEGIETERHIDMLAELNCDIGQGFHIARPMTADDVIVWLETKAKEAKPAKRSGKTPSLITAQPASQLPN
ncbi:MAG: EAL domain-containing protein, partial [Pseudomonadota bacterium]